MSVMEETKPRACPNCMTDDPITVVSITEFKTFAPLLLRTRLAEGVEVFECSGCQSQWMSIGQSHLLHLLYPKAKTIIDAFFTESNILSKQILSQLEEIRFVGRDVAVPAAVRLRDGTVIPRALIHVNPWVWPVAITHLNPRFGSSIEEVFPSAEALTFEQRLLQAQAREVRMGCAFLFLERAGCRFMLPQEIPFIPVEFGNPNDFQIVGITPEIATPAPLIPETSIVHFFVRVIS